jgi:hypothetical protein
VAPDRASGALVRITMPRGGRPAVRETTTEDPLPKQRSGAPEAA